MDIWDLTKLVFRRWYVFLPLLVATVALVLTAGVSVKPDYSASGHVQLIPATESASAAREAGRVPNPWGDLGFAALGTAVNLKVSQDEKLMKELVAAGLTDSFSITMAWNVSYFSIEAVGKTPEQASGTVQRIMKTVSDEVAAQQAQFDVAPNDMITTLALDRGDKVEAVTSTRTRVLVVVAGVGLMVSVAGSIVVDALLRRRQRRRDFDAAEEMLGAKVPRGDNGRRVGWSPPSDATDPQRTAPPPTRTIREPERPAEIVPVGWPVLASPAPTSALEGAHEPLSTSTPSAFERVAADGDVEDPVLVDQTLILPLAGPSRPASKQQK